jgi:hypothetical protein
MFQNDLKISIYKIYRMECTKCKKKFKTNRSFEYHVEKGVCSNKNFRCVECGQSYQHKKSLYRHIRKKHPQVKFTSSDDRKSMIEDITSKNNCQQEIVKIMFDCAFCNKKFPSKYNLLRHMSNNCKKAKEAIGKATKPVNKTTNINNGSINNGTVNNNTINNNTTNNINININQFEKEDISKISYEDFMEAIKDPEDIPVKYLELKHIKTPSNMNICIKNKEMMYVFKGDHWQELRMADVCHLMKNGAIYDIDQFIRANPVKNSEAINRRLDEVEGERKYDKIMDLLIDNSGPLINNFNHNKAPTISFATLMENKKKNRK